MKQCSHCKKWKNENEFSKNKITKDGLNYYCRNCDNEKNRIYYILHKKKNSRTNIKERLTKKCYKCKKIKHISEFNKDSSRDDGLSYICKTCDKLKNKKYYEEHINERKEYFRNNRERRLKRGAEYWKKEGKKGKIKDRVLKRNFGISLIDYNNILKKQNNCCAICGKHQSKFNKALFVDHDHKTDKVRGLLCSLCNNGLGDFKDNIKNIKVAIEYLIKKRKNVILYEKTASKMQKQYERLLIEYNTDCCLICGKKDERLNVDHNHVTGEVRGILCQDCNRGLGQFKDNILLLKKAIEYLKNNI